MKKDRLFELFGHEDVLKEMDVKSLVVDIVRERYSETELLNVFFTHLEYLDEEHVAGYFYRKFGQ